MDRITRSEDVIDMRLVAGKPNRFRTRRESRPHRQAPHAGQSCLSCESFIGLAGNSSAEANRPSFAGMVHGCLLPVFSVASAAAISSNEGTCHNDMYGSGPSQEPAARVRPSGENLSDRQLPGRGSSVAKVKVTAATSRKRLPRPLLRRLRHAKPDSLISPSRYEKLSVSGKR